jgi:hypothetical protein
MRGRLKDRGSTPEEGAVDIDPHAMGELIEASQDIHHDAMVATVDSLDEMVEAGIDARTVRSRPNAKRRVGTRHRG